MFTKEARPTKVYKVIFEHLPTGIYSTVYVENTSSYDASTSVMNNLGSEYDLIMSIYVNANDLN